MNPETFKDNNIDKNIYAKEKDHEMVIEDIKLKSEIEEKEHEMTIKDIKLKSEIEEKQWRSCCFQLEPESSLFFAKLSISSMVISLCAYQLITLKDCNYQSLYSSLLSSVITFWLSRPK